MRYQRSLPHTWQISGKDLGVLQRKDFCPRCFWISRHHARPWQIFPGIFSSIDSYAKRLIDHHFASAGSPPPWVAGLKDIVGLYPTETASSFFMIDPSTRIKLTGAPDVIFKLTDGTLMIADYKTARFTEAQDQMSPVYEVQLNAYRDIARALKWPKVSRLALIYTEPPEKDDPIHPEFHSPLGFVMNFRSRFKEIEIRPKLTAGLLKKADQIFHLPKPPKSNEKCKDCEKLDAIISSTHST